MDGAAATRELLDIARFKSGIVVHVLGPKA